MQNNCLKFVLLALLIGVSCANPLQRAQRKHKSARQVEATTATIIVDAKTPYPAAGFRPQIPFELPNERQPKAAAEPTTSTVAATIEDFGLETTTTAAAAATTEQDVLARKPADTYGVPEIDITVKLPAAEAEADIPADDEIVAEVAVVPSEDFQPPASDAVEEFAVAAIDTDVAVDADVPVADLPAAVETTSTSSSEEVNEAGISTVDINAAELPANTYGAPEVSVSLEGVERAQFVPAETYGVPDLTVGNADDVEENELLPASAENIDPQIELLSQLGSLRSGRLILLPGSGKRQNQIFFAVPQRRTRARSGRLIRI